VLKGTSYQSTAVTPGPLVSVHRSIRCLSTAPREGSRGGTLHWVGGERPKAKRPTHGHGLKVAAGSRGWGLHAMGGVTRDNCQLSQEHALALENVEEKIIRP
jgi:hypothetical protein